MIEPCWDAAIARGDLDAAGFALINLVVAEPVGALRKLDTVDFSSPILTATIKLMAVRALSRSDPARAEEVADSIADHPDYRAKALVGLAKMLPSERRTRKLMLLARAEGKARAANNPDTVATVALAFANLGDKEKAKALVAECIDPAKVVPSYRSYIACMLARFNPQAALNLAQGMVPGNRAETDRILKNVAINLAADNPAEAEGTLRRVSNPHEPTWLVPAIVWKMAASDPARARRLADEFQRDRAFPRISLYLAYGLKRRDPAAANQAFWQGIQGIDRLIDEEASPLPEHIRIEIAALLPLVEQIDPALVPELFWRAVAARPPIGDPRALGDNSSGELVELLAWYHREVATALFEPIRTQFDQSDDREVIEWKSRFLTWSLIDPRGAVARIEQIQPTTELETNALLRLKGAVGSRLARLYEDRWQNAWHGYGYGELSDPLEREIW